jgi:CHAT domain-containing protein
MSALLKAQKGAELIRRDAIKALVIAEPNAPGLPPIYDVDEEMRTVSGLIGSVSASTINDIDVTPMVQSALDALPEAHLLHLSCHGKQNYADPLESNFALHDGQLTIAAIMKLSLPSAMLAFLSACETAKGDEEQPDQAVHLAASMLFCGFRSIIATMW